jgi:hypothetical protein
VCAIFLLSAAEAGLFFALCQRIDWGEAKADAVFEGFRQLYWPSVVAGLPAIGMYLALTVGLVAVVIGCLFGLGLFHHQDPQDTWAMAQIIATIVVLCLPVFAIYVVIVALFQFCLLAVWDRQESSWEAIKDSVFVVRTHYLRALGLLLLVGLILIGAFVLGVAGLCLGIFFTMPFAAVWTHASMIYAYRSWTGRPLVQRPEEMEDMEIIDTDPPPVAPPEPGV